MPHFQLDREPVPNRKKPTKWDSRDMLKKTATVVTSSNRKDHLLTISSSMNSTSSPKTAPGKKLSTTLRPTSHRDHRPAPYALQVSLKVLPFELPASSFAPSPWKACLPFLFTDTSSRSTLASPSSPDPCLLIHSSSGERSKEVDHATLGPDLHNILGG